MKNLILIAGTLSLLQTKAQLSLKGIGIFGALTESANYYDNKDQGRKLDTPYVYSRFYPQSHISKEFFNWGAGLFLEFAKRDNVRWQTELEYTHTGGKERPLINAFTGERAAAFGVNKYTYIQWNNYLKFYNPIGYGAHWYVMPGIRLEYLFQNAAPIFAPVSANFPKFWFSGDLGLGYEFPLFKQISAFVEFHWNPDLIKHIYNDVAVRSRTFELRAGLVYRKKRRGVDDCTAPRYNGPAY